jgi:hypothetical protein
MPYDVAFVKRRYPEHARTIDELASRSENFRDLCLDMESAEQIMLDWKGSKAPEAPARYIELSTLVSELTAEFMEMIKGASVVPFKKPRG